MKTSGSFCFKVEHKLKIFWCRIRMITTTLIKTINATSHLKPRNSPVCRLYMHVYSLTSLSLQTYWFISGSWFAATISWPIMKLWWYIAKSPSHDWSIYRRQFSRTFFFSKFSSCFVSLKTTSFLHTLSPLIFSSLFLELIASCVVRDLSLLVTSLVNVSILAFSNRFEDLPIKITFKVCDL